MKRFQNTSKFRDSVVAASKRDNWFVFPAGSSTVNTNAGLDPCPMKATTKFISFRCGSSGSSVGFVLLANYSKAETSVSAINQGAIVSDFDLTPYLVGNAYHLAAVGADDGTIRLWSVNESLGKEFESLSTLKCSQSKRIDNILFNPGVSHLLSASSSNVIQIFNAETEANIFSLDALDLVQTMSWKQDGSLLTSIGKDNILRVFDPRAGLNSIATTNAHNGVKPSRIVWAGMTDLLVSTGFNSMREREFAIWDARNLSKSLALNKLDTSTGILQPLFDPDTNMLFLCGKGDSAIRWLEIKPDDSSQPFDASGIPYSGNATFSGACLVPKLGLDVMDCEVARILAVTSDGNTIVPISANVPRRSKIDFHADIFPDTRDPEATLSVADWLDFKPAAASVVCVDPTKRLATLKPKAVTNTTISSTEASLGITSNAPPETKPIAKDALADVPTDSAIQSRKSSLARTTVNYRFVSAKTQTKYEDLKGLNANVPNEMDALQCNQTFLTLPISGPGGRIGFWPIVKPGRLPARIPCIINTSDVFDFKLNPFKEDEVITACDDGKLRKFKLRLDASADIVDPEWSFIAHNDRVIIVQYHPTAADIVLTYSPSQGTPTISIWNLETKNAVSSVRVSDLVFSVAFNMNGELFAAVCRDKTIQVFESRTSKKISEGPSHDGAKAARVVWFNELDGRLCSVVHEEPIILENVSDSMFKLDNPTKSNPSKILKSKIQTLEEKCNRLLQNQYKSLYHRIKELLDDNYFETEDTIYLLHSGLALPFKRRYYPTLEDAQSNLDEMVHQIFKDTKLLPKMIEKQHSVQQKLFRLVMNYENDEDVKEIHL